MQLDLVSGFHSNPIELIEDGEADLIVGSVQRSRRGISWYALSIKARPHLRIATKKLRAGISHRTDKERR